MRLANVRITEALAAPARPAFDALPDRALQLVASPAFTLGRLLAMNRRQRRDDDHSIGTVKLDRHLIESMRSDGHTKHDARFRGQHGERWMVDDDLIARMEVVPVEAPHE